MRRVSTPTSAQLLSLASSTFSREELELKTLTTSEKYYLTSWHQRVHYEHQKLQNLLFNTDEEEHTRIR